MERLHGTPKNHRQLHPETSTTHFKPNDAALIVADHDQSNQNISRQSGFLPRCLLAYPKSAMGARYYQEPPVSKSYLDDYEKRIVDCLNQSQHLSQKGCHKLPTLLMSIEANAPGYSFLMRLNRLKLSGAVGRTSGLCQ